MPSYGSEKRALLIQALPLAPASPVSMDRVATAPWLLNRLAAMVIRGDLTVPIYRTYELEGAGRALKEFTAGKRGKVAITVR
jgi:hypothetical protein